MIWGVVIVLTLIVLALLFMSGGTGKPTPRP